MSLGLEGLDWMDAGLFIVESVWKDTNLTTLEKCVLSKLIHFECWEGSIFVKNKDIAKEFNMSKSYASKILDSLIRKGYLLKRINGYNERVLYLAKRPKELKELQW